MGAFAKTSSGRERWSGDARVPRHRHAEAYAALVLAGHYEECGSRGRFRVGPGDILLHDAFDAHLDRFHCRGADILNLPLNSLAEIPFAHGCIGDVDHIVRIAESDIDVAATIACLRANRATRANMDWPDCLADDLVKDPSCRIDALADEYHLAAETVSRGFRQVFGISPATFRAEARARRAFDKVVHGLQSLVEIAAETGFADQAHMTRAVKALTGMSPGAWRRGSNWFKTQASIRAWMGA